MQKRMFILIAVIFSSLLVIAACSSSDVGDAGGNAAGDAGEKIELRVATGLSGQHAWWVGTMEPWMERVTELTDGQVEFETFVGGELVEIPDEADAVLDGTIDVGLILPIYEPDQYPLVEVTMLPLSHSDAYIASKAWRKLFESDTELQDGLSFYDMQFDDFMAFPTSTTMEYSISTTGKEFNTASDIAGTSLRTASRIHELYADHTGINSITMAAVEMYDAMSRGAFDGSFYSISDWTAYGFQDLYKYTITGVNYGHFNAMIGMSKEKWDSFPENVQEAMIQAHDELFISGADEWVDRAEAIISDNEEAGGKFVDYTDLAPDVQEVLDEGITDTWIEYAELLEENGLPGKKLIALWRDLILEEGGEVPEEIMELSVE